MMDSLDLDFVRGHFPALGGEWAFFDNAGGSLPLRGVTAAVCEHLTRFPVQLGASYEVSQRAAERVEAGRRAVATLIGGEPGEIVLGASTTASMNLLARALRPRWQAGDQVVVTDLDHAANIVPWRRLGLETRTWRLRPETASLELEDLEALLTERTRLVAMTHCSNLAGQILDIAAVAERVHAAGALLVVDGVAYAPHRRVDVGSLGADFYCFSTYKTYGPHVGVMWGRRSLLESLEGQNHSFIETLPSKLEPGGVNYELVSSLPAVLDYFLELEAHHSGGNGNQAPVDQRLDRAFASVAEHEEALATRLLSFLDAHPKVHIHGLRVADRKRRVPTVSFTVEGWRSQDLPPLLDREKLAVRWGHFYAPDAVRALGLPEDDGVVRVSLVHYNSLDEVDRLVEALERAIGA